MRPLLAVVILALAGCSGSRSDSLSQLAGAFELVVAAREDFVEHAPERKDELARLTAQWEQLESQEDPAAVASAIAAELPDAKAEPGVQKPARTELVVTRAAKAGEVGDTVSALFRAAPFSFVQAIEAKGKQVRVALVVVRPTGSGGAENHARRELVRKVQYELDRPPSRLPWSHERPAYDRLQALLAKFRALGARLDQLHAKDEDLALALERDRAQKVEQVLAKMNLDAKKAHDGHLSRLSAPWLRWVKLSFRKGGYAGHLGAPGHSVADVQTLLGADVTVSQVKDGVFEVSWP